MKKGLLRGLLMLSTAAALSIGSSAVQASADTTSKNFDPACIEINYASQKMTIEESMMWQFYNGSPDIEILFGVSTAKTAIDKTTKEKTTKLTTSLWDVYKFERVKNEDEDEEDETKIDPTRRVTIDLSFLNRAKDNYIQIKGNKHTEPVTIKIPAVQKDLKIKYNKIDGTVTLTNKKGQEPDLDTDKFEYRTKYGSWDTFDFDEELTAFQQRGATLYIRTEAPKKVVLDSKDDVTHIDDILDANGNPLDVLSAGSFPGVELKATVTKLANAPTINVNYLKGTITIPKGSYFRFINANDTEISEDWNGEDTEKKAVTYSIYSSPELQELMANGGSIEIYKPETSKAPASKINYVYCSPKPELIARAADDVTATSLNQTVDGSQVINLVWNEEEKKDVKGDTLFSAGLEETAPRKYTLHLENTSTDAYEVLIQDSDYPPLPTKNATKKIAAGKSVDIKKLAEGKNVFIRIAGNQSQKKWTSQYVPFGKIIPPSEDE